MPENSKRRTGGSNKFVLDAYAVLALLEGGEGGALVKNLLMAPGNRFFLSVVNFGEIYYITLRRKGREAAEKVEHQLRETDNIQIVGVTWERVKMAAGFKAVGRISYADCFAAVLAVEKKAPVLTGDREFERLGDLVAVRWIDGANAVP